MSVVGVRRVAVRAALTVLLLLAVLYAAAAGWLWANQRSFLFPADRTRTSVAATGLQGFEDVTLATPDGERLVAWWRPPPPGAGAVIYFHGNGGSIANRAGRLRDLADAGLGVLGVSYRGYGGSTGSPSEAGLILDARAAADWLAARVPPQRTALFGESLGTGVALALAGERSFGGVVLDSPYASVERLQRRQAPWLPVRLLSTDRFDSQDRIRKVREPVFVAHCTGDRVIPIGEGRRLYARAPAGAGFLPVEGCGHIQTWTDEAARRRMLEALRMFTSPAPVSTPD